MEEDDDQFRIYRRHAKRGHLRYEPSLKKTAVLLAAATAALGAILYAKCVMLPKYMQDTSQTTRDAGAEVHDAGTSDTIDDMLKE